MFKQETIFKMFDEMEFGGLVAMMIIHDKLTKDLKNNNLNHEYRVDAQSAAAILQFIQFNIALRDFGKFKSELNMMKNSNINIYFILLYVISGFEIDTINGTEGDKRKLEKMINIKKYW